MRDPVTLRELDCKVARWVFKAEVIETPMQWTTALHPRTHNVAKPPDADFPVMFKEQATTPESVPRYSADNEWVDRIEKQLRGRYSLTAVTHGSEGEANIRSFKVVLSNRGVSNTWEGDGATAGEALCVAAVAAVLALESR
jgi:hypothetical protein